MKAGKVWGSTLLILQTPLVEIHRLTIKPHRQCSLHCHQYRWNAFMVLSGHLTIEVHKNDYDLVDKTEIGVGEFTTVRPGEFHRFISGAEPVDAIEIYYPEALSDADIVRKDIGGIVALERKTDVFGNLKERVSDG